MKIKALKNYAVSVAAAAAVLSFATGASATMEIIALNNNTQFNLGSPYHVGQEFTVSSTQNVNNIQFNFENSTDNPVALGNGYLFSEPYSGSAADLGSSSPGYLGETAASGNYYTFGSNVVLANGISYYLYSDYLFGPQE